MEKSGLQWHVKTIEEQFVLACAKEPRRFQSLLQKILHTGPTARCDAEESERQRSVLTMGELLRHTTTPMGQFYSTGSRKAEAAPVWRERRLFALGFVPSGSIFSGSPFLQGIVFPKQVEHCSGNLETKASEPCARRALKEAHRAMSFLEHAAGVEEASRVTSTVKSKNGLREVTRVNIARETIT